MKKIDKSLILSNNYKNAEKELKKDEHEPYESKFKRDYYTDIKMSLLYCQGGLCAYTEQMICEPSFIYKQNWDDDKYKSLEKLEKYKVEGDLEHFDESLKPKNAFSWDNFFVVIAHVNRNIKGTKKIIKGILKPDDKDYNPYEYFIWIKDDTNRDIDVYIFAPNKDFSIKKQKDIKYMIDILGINYLDYKRQRQLNEWRDKYEMGFEVKPYQYPTAWSMTLKQLKEEKLP